MTPKVYVLTFLGDVMLGRLIDQLLPNHVHEPDEARHVATSRRYHDHLKSYSYSSPWGNVLKLLQRSDMLAVNLETSATTSSQKWPDKVFNYRMHPANIECLKAANVDYVSLANNHTLDFGKAGLFETIETVRSAGIACAGAGLTKNEATTPAILTLPRRSQEHAVHAYSFSDHPQDWSAVSEFNLLTYSNDFRKSLVTTLNREIKGENRPSLKIVSIHWGPNYSWRPDDRIISLAHFLIDNCGIDIIHGHSSHHIQGVEMYKGKLVIYGCGDFVDDYAVVPGFRNDLSAVWNVLVEEDENNSLFIRGLEVYPSRIKQFRAELLETHDPDHSWVRQKLSELSGHFGTKVNEELGSEGQLVIEIARESAIC